MGDRAKHQEGIELTVILKRERQARDIKKKGMGYSGALPFKTRKDPWEGGKVHGEITEVLAIQHPP